MREILGLLRRIREHTDRVHELRVYGDGTWIVTDEKRTRVCEDDSKRCDDPTDDIIAALKAKLPPTKEEALADLDAFISLRERPRHSCRGGIARHAKRALPLASSVWLAIFTQVGYNV